MAEGFNLLDDAQEQENSGEEKDEKIWLSSLGNPLRTSDQQENQGRSQNWRIFRAGQTSASDLSESYGGNTEDSEKNG